MKGRLAIFIVMMLSCLDALSGNYHYTSGAGMTCHWSAEDVLGVYTQSGTRIKFWVSEIGQGGHKAGITANGWALAANAEYYAYMPYSPDYYINSNPITALPVSYLGQRQTQNGSASHLQSYDYMHSVAQTTDASADFDFKHYGSVLHIAYKLPKAMTVSAIDMTTNGKVIPVKAMMNLPEQRMDITERDSVLSLAMENIQMEKGDTLDAFMMLPPVDLSEQSLTFSLIDVEAGDTLAIMTKGCNIVAGRLYEVPLCKIERLVQDVTTTDSQDNALQSSLLLPCAEVSDFPVDEENRFHLELAGDANGDEELTMEDAYLIVRYFLGFPNVKINLRLADANGDGVVTMADANEVMNLIKNK